MTFGKEKRFPGDTASHLPIKDVPLPKIQLDSLRYVVQQPAQGAEKHVYCMTDGQRTIAAKIVLPKNDSDIPIDVAMQAERELYSYYAVRKTALKPYIPELLGLLTIHDKVVGLAVEWQDGQVLYDSTIILDRKIIDDFYLAAQTCTYQLDGQTFFEANIFYAPERTPQLWISEIQVINSIDTQTYEKKLEKYFKRLYAFVWN